MEINEYLNEFSNSPPSPVLMRKSRHKRKSNGLSKYNEKRVKLRIDEEKHNFSLNSAGNNSKTQFSRVSVQTTSGIQEVSSEKSLDVTVQVFNDFVDSKSRMKSKIDTEDTDFKGFNEEECNFSFKYCDNRREIICNCFMTKNEEVCNSSKKIEINQNTDSKYASSEEIRPSQGTGFATASGKTITICNDSLPKVNIFNDIQGIDKLTHTSTGNFEIENNSGEYSKEKTNTEQILPRTLTNNGSLTATGQITTEKSPFPEIRRIFGNRSDDNQFTEEPKGFSQVPPKASVGFSTAAGKVIEIPQASMSKITQIFKNVHDISDLVNEKTTGNIPKNFSTVSFSQVSNNFLKFNEKVENSLQVFPVGNVGFSTATGKKIEIPQDSLSKITQIFKDIPDSSGLLLNNSNDFSQVQKNEIPEPYSLEIEQIMKDITDFPNFDEKPNDIPQVSTHKSVGFSTCTGKKIEIPRASLNRLNQIFKDTPDLVELIKESESESFLLKQPNNYEDFSKGQHDGIIQSSKNLSVGFSTATGKKIEVAQASLMKLNEIFKDTPDLAELIKKSVTENNSEGFPSMKNERTHQSSTNEPFRFSTATGKKIDIPQDSLQKLNQIFKDTPNLDELIKKSEIVNNSQRYSTALGTKNEIPSSSTQNPEISTKASVGFSTATGKNIEISQASLTRMKQIFRDTPDLAELITKSETENIPLKLPKNSDGFSTALGKKIETPDSPVKKTNEIFKDIPNIGNLSEEKSINNEFNTPTRNNTIPSRKTLGVSTSSMKKFSNATLNRVKSIFSDMNLDDLKLPSEFSYLNNSATNNNPTRFSSSTPVRNYNRILFPSPHLTPVQIKLSNNINNINEPFLIQKPTTGNSTTWLEKLNERKMALEKELELITKKQEAINDQIQTNFVTKKPEIAVKKTEFTLFDVANLEKQSKLISLQDINKTVLGINPQNSTLVHFNKNWHETATVKTEDGCVLIPNCQGLIGLSEIEAAFSSMVDIDKNLIPSGWIKNHYKWIVWKLASYERHFPSVLSECFTIYNVIKQLRYRYFRELYNVEHPALRKIYETDDVPQKRLVLCVSNIFKNKNIELELTDGWYSIRTIIDNLLIQQVRKRKIQIGTKLMISCAEMLNCSGCHPLETEQSSHVRLKINYNSTRRAGRFSKLGYQKFSLPFLVKLESCDSSGGQIGGIKIFIARLYSTIYKETIGDKIVWRNEKAEYKIAEDVDGSERKRSVVSVFQCAVIDTLCDNNEKLYKCTFWDAQYFPLELLEENKTFNFFGVSMKSNNEIVCNRKTRFEISKFSNVANLKKYARKYVAIDSYETMLENSTFSEFDTVGIILKVQIDEDKQTFWLTNTNKQLIQVKIHEGPDTNCILNKVENGMKIAVYNLKLEKNFQNYSLALGNYHTVVTENPKFKFLKEELEKLDETIIKPELDVLINEINDKIDTIQNRNHLQESTHSSDLNCSQITHTDLVMSMINIDEVVKNTM